MEKVSRRLEEIKKNGYNLDFSEVFNPAFEIYKKIAGIAGAVIVLLMVFLMIFVLIGLFAFIGGVGLTSELQNFNPLNLSLPVLLLLGVFSIAGSILGTIVNAGFIKLAYNAYYNLDFGFSTVFDYFKSDETKELVIFGATLGAINLCLTMLFEFLEIKLVAAIFQFVIAIFVALALPLIIFGKQNVMNALSGSISVVSKNFLMVFLLLIVSYILAMVGLIACGIGLFFTIPIVYAMQLSIYLNIFENKNDIAPAEFNTEENFI